MRRLQVGGPKEHWLSISVVSVELQENNWVSLTCLQWKEGPQVQSLIADLQGGMSGTETQLTRELISCPILAEIPGK